MRIAVLGALTIMALACHKAPEAAFEHSIANGPYPWTIEPSPKTDDIFSFAIVSDLYGGNRTGIFEVAVEQLNLLRPELVLSVGDLINGGTEDVIRLHREWNAFDAMANQLNAPLFRVGGNHDFTNVVMREVWQERYGPRYYCFVYRDILFLVLDSEDYTEERMQEIYRARARYIKLVDSSKHEEALRSDYFRMPERRTGKLSEEQVTYFEQSIAAHQDVHWTFLLMHKPVYMDTDTNWLQPIERALDSRPYTVVNGHFHSYGHLKRNGRDYITLGTTGGGQSAQDPLSFDHITWISLTELGPLVVNLRMDGVLDITGNLPGGGDSLRFQLSTRDAGDAN